MTENTDDRTNGGDEPHKCPGDHPQYHDDNALNDSSDDTVPEYEKPKINKIKKSPTQPNELLQELEGQPNKISLVKEFLLYSQNCCGELNLYKKTQDDRDSLPGLRLIIARQIFIKLEKLESQFKELAMGKTWNQLTELHNNKIMHEDAYYRFCSFPVPDTDYIFE